MNRRVLGLLAGIVAAPILARLLAILGAGRRGAALMEALDRRQLTPFEHRTLAHQWSGALAKSIVAAVLTLFVAEQVRQEYGEPYMSGGAGVTGRTELNWPQILHRGSEILLALGAILKVLASFVEEREEISQQS